MITGIEIRRRIPVAGGAAFGQAGAYERIEGSAVGALDPRHPANRGIALLDAAPCDSGGRVAYRADFVLLRPCDPRAGNGRLLYEVNNRGRIMLFPMLCGGRHGNHTDAMADLGNALPLKRGFSLLWSGWDPGAPPATGLSLDVPTIGGLTRPIREEFVSGTRLGRYERFPLSYEAAGPAQVTVRRTQDAPRRAVPATMPDPKTVQPLEPIEIGSIYEVRYLATRPRVMGIGFAATRDLVSHLRRHGEDLLGRPVEHTIGFGISQSGRYLRDHIAQGFNADESGARVFDGVFVHVAGTGRLFLNTPFAQPFRTRTRHQDHDFPEVVFPFSTAVQHDTVTGKNGALLRGDPTDPLLIETNTGTEYWQKGASLLHTDTLGTRDVSPPHGARYYLLAGTQHAGQATMPRDHGPCRYPRNWHDPMPAIRALLIALDTWVTTGQPPPESRIPRIADGTLVPVDQFAFPAIPGFSVCPSEAESSETDKQTRNQIPSVCPSEAESSETDKQTRHQPLRPCLGFTQTLTESKPPNAANDLAPLVDWTAPTPNPRGYTVLVPQVDADGNEIAGIRLPDIAVPSGTFTGWNLYAAPYPEGELADRDGAYLAFPRTEADRNGDPRRSLASRYPPGTYLAAVRQVVAALLADRLLLAEDAEKLVAEAARNPLVA